MAGAYAKEFEKWLQQGDKERIMTKNESSDMDDSNDEVDDYQTVSDVKDKKEQVPILFSDNRGDALNSARQHCYPDEPPILEPVRYGLFTKVSESLTKSEEELDEFDHTKMQTKLEIKKTGCKESEKTLLESDKSFICKSKESENIFDKFNLLSDVDNFPPPLIPSHEAHLTNVDAKDDDSLTEKSYATLQNLSPNFCAMEADSTSEVFKGDQNSSFDSFKDKREKTSFYNEIGVECDSTCMLGASPYVVSPGSVSNVESDNQTPIREEMAISPVERENWNAFCIRESDALHLPSQQPQIEHLSTQTDTNYAANHFDTMRLNQHEHGWDCPKLEAVMDMGESRQTELCKRSTDVDEPPVLTIMPPSVVSPPMPARRKRHTIDSTSFSRPKKRLLSKGSRGKNSKYADPKLSPTTSNTEEKGTNECTHDSDGTQLSSVKQNLDSLSRTHSRSHSRPQKHQKRRQTLPIVDQISYGCHLPQHLYSFVVGSSQLFVLQKRMHHLLSLLFPQLSSELDQINSSNFEVLLKDLLMFLKEKADRCDKDIDFGKSGTHSGICADKNDIPGDIVNAVSETMSNVNVTSRCGKFIRSSFARELDKHSSPKNELEESGHCSRYESNPAEDHHQHSSVLSNSFLPVNVNSTSIIESVSTDSVIPRLSKFDLTKQKERALKHQPSVLIHKDPCAVHKNFFRLSCRTLQQLLPDLDIDLINELANSPDDLLHFIDSVITSNSS